MAITLPTEDYVPENQGIPSDFSMIVFGPPKVGKTTFAASFPKSIVVECEPGGARYTKCRKVDINNLTDLRDAYMAIRDSKDYDTVVIDTLDRVASWIEDDICKDMGIANIFEAKKGERNGAQWGHYSQRVITFLESWKALGKRVIFLAHTKKAETDGNGVLITPKTINLYGQAASRVMALVENIGHLYVVEDVNGNSIRKLSFRAGASIEAGSRHPALRDKIIDLDHANPYGSFAALFGTPTVKKAAKREVMA